MNSNITSATRFGAVAARLVANGYAPVPILPADKRPPMKEWQHYAFVSGDETRYAEHGAGILTRETAGADIDVNDPDAAAAVETMIREVLHVGDAAEIPRRIGQAPRVLLPLRCERPFAKLATAQFAMRSCPEAKPSKVEILCDGQQFVAYGIHKDTHRPYVWNGGGDLLAVPRADLPAITEAQAREIVAQAESILEEWGERVSEKPGDKKPGATPGDRIPEGARNETLYKFGCKLAREGFAVAEIEAALTTMNRRCSVPLDDAELQAIVDSVAKFVTDTETTAPMPAVYTAAEMAARPAAAREWIVDRWLPAGCNATLGGHGGSGKSMICATLVVSVAEGAAFYGLPVTQGPVIVYACEDDVDEWHFRLGCAATHRGVDLASLPIHVIDALESERDPALFAAPMTDPRADAAVTPVGAWLAERAKAVRPALIVIDAATDAFAGDEIRRRDVRRYLRTMRHELARDGACVLHILHVDKAAARGKATTDYYSGSTDWNNGVRARLALYRPRQGDDDEAEEDDDAPLRLELQKSNYSRRGAFVDLRYDEAAHVFVQVGTSGAAPAGDMVTALAKRIDEHRVLRTLAAAEDAGDPVFSAERANRNAAVRLKAAEALPKTYRGRAGRVRLFELLLRLKAEGLLTEDAVRTAGRHQAGIWRVTAAGRAAMNSHGPAGASTC
jgi:RecA-family ATPase